MRNRLYSVGTWFVRALSKSWGITAFRNTYYATQLNGKSMQLTLTSHDPFENAIRPLWEMAAYEAMWRKSPASFKRLADLFAQHPGQRPSDLVPNAEIQKAVEELKTEISTEEMTIPGLLIHNTFDYPNRLRDAKDPVELLYYFGDLALLRTRMVAVVGSRKPSSEGILRATKLVKLLVDDSVTIVSGLAEGIDSAAHNAAIEHGGKTIAVIGTPLNHFYPKINKELQQEIAKKHLLVSQVPFLRYRSQSINGNRLFFPERNKTMAALTEATIIVEASDTSGTLVQARAALGQGRKLFILDSCFQNPSIKWPATFEKLGAYRVKEYEEIRKVLELDASPPTQN